jgi:homoserine kinase type II
MTQYTKLLENEIQETGSKYELKIFGSKSIKEGIGNSNYEIETNQGKHILTVFEIESFRVKQMSKVLRLLEKYEFPAPRIKKTKKGGVLAKYREKLVMVKPYISGQAQEELEEVQVSQIGTALAKLHEIPAPKYLSRNHTYVEKTYPQVIEQEIDQDYGKWVRERHKRIVENIPSDLPVGLVHGDIFYDNVLFEGEKFKAILDFEDVSRIYKVFDLGMAVVGTCTDETEITLSKVRALVKGYQKIRMLEEAERDSLQEFVEWAAVLTSTWRFWKYNIEMPSIEESRKHTQMVAIAKNISSIPKEEFAQAVFYWMIRTN